MNFRYKALVEIEFTEEISQEGLESVANMLGTTTKEDTLSRSAELYNEDLRKDVLDCLPCDATVRVTGEITEVE